MAHEELSLRYPYVLESMLRKEQYLVEQLAKVPVTYQCWHDQCVVADATLVLALREVAWLLPSEVREVVERLVQLEHEVWLREVTV